MLYFFEFKKQSNVRHTIILWSIKNGSSYVNSSQFQMNWIVHKSKESVR